MRITASYSKKVQVAQYEPVEISCFVEEDLDEFEDATNAEAYEYLFNFCKEQVTKRIDAELRHIDAKKEIKTKAQHQAEMDEGAPEVADDLADGIIDLVD